MDEKYLGVIAEAIRSVSKRTQSMAITANSRLIEDLALDSLDLVGVLMKLEDHYAIKIELDDIPNLQTVNELGEHLGTLLGGNSAAA